MTTGKEKKRVALLVGGWSAERQVSLNKGKEVEAALREAGYDLDVIDVSKDMGKLVAALTPKPDIVFNNLYGKGGEDGTIQGILEVLEIPYTHSGVVASAVGMDKPLCKKVAKGVGVQVAEDMILSKEEVLAGGFMEPPYVIKPPSEGSSVGIRLVLDGDNHPPIDEDSWCFGDEVMVERYIPGRELTVAVLDGQPQTVTEIIPHTKFFDYEAKYHDERTELVMPAKLPEKVFKAALENARLVYNALGCHGIARCDFRYDDSVGTPDGLFFLEINTQPGLTAESIGPSQVIYNGKTFVELCSHLVETAKCYSKAERKEQEGSQSPESGSQRQTA